MFFLNIEVFNPKILYNVLFLAHEILNSWTGEYWQRI